MSICAPGWKLLASRSAGTNRRSCGVACPYDCDRQRAGIFTGRWRERKNCHRIFVLQPESGEHPKGHPKLRIFCLNYSKQPECAPDPEQGLKGVHCELVINCDPSGRKGGDERSKCGPETLRSQRASQHRQEDCEISKEV